MQGRKFQGREFEEVSALISTVDPFIVRIKRVLKADSQRLIAYSSDVTAHSHFLFFLCMVQTVSLRVWLWF